MARSFDENIACNQPQRLATPGHAGLPAIEALEWREASGDSVFGFAPNAELIARVAGFDPGATSGAWISYDIPHRETSVWRPRMPLPTGQWRGLGLAPNTFAIESFMDEAARLAGKGPLQFRLDHLAGDAEGRRMTAVHSAAADRVGWGSVPPAGHALPPCRQGAHRSRQRRAAHEVLRHRI